MALSLQQAMLWSNIVTAGANAFNAVQSRNATNNATNAQLQSGREAAEINRQASNDALKVQTDIYNDSVNRSLPWLDAGRAGLNSLTGLMGMNVPQSARSNVQPPGQGGGAAPGGGIPNYRPDATGGSGNTPGGGGPGLASTVIGTGIGVGVPLAIGALSGGGAAAAGAGAGAAGGGGAAAGGALGMGAAGAAALIGGGAAAIAIPWLKSQAHHEANTIVKNLENPFHLDYLRPLNSSFVELKNSGKLDRATAQQYIDSLKQQWGLYQTEAEKYGQGGSDEKTVSGQSVANLRPTVERLIADMERDRDALPDAPAAANTVQAPPPVATPQPTAQPQPAITAGPTATQAMAPPRGPAPDFNFASRYRRA